MRAAVFTGPRRIEITNVPLPRPGPAQVLVELEGCGICGSDLPVWQGRTWFQYPFPAGAPGHEGWGRVAQVGDGVNDVMVGDRVALLSYNAYAQYDIADAQALVPLAPENTIFPGEAIGCAMNIYRRSAIRRGQTVAIVGIGFMGALLTQLCTGAGARVIALSRRHFALSIARRCGACEILSIDSEQVVKRVMELTDGKGCERVIEAAGQQQSLDLAGQMVAVRGRLVIAGYHQDGDRRVDMQTWNWRGIDVINAHERDRRRYISGIRRAAAQIARGGLHPELLYTHAFTLADLAGAFHALERRQEGFMKAWICAAANSRSTRYRPETSGLPPPTGHESETSNGQQTAQG